MTLENLLPFKDCWPQSFMSIVQLIKICLYFMILKIILLLFFFSKRNFADESGNVWFDLCPSGQPTFRQWYSKSTSPSLHLHNWPIYGIWLALEAARNGSATLLLFNFHHICLSNNIRILKVCPSNISRQTEIIFWLVGTIQKRSSWVHLD